jgi:hypothetical protein
VAEPAAPCPADDVLVEVALGALDGRERADAEAHLARCEACRERVADLSGTVDALLAAAPADDPPLGFEQAVLDRVRAASGDRATAGRAPTRLRARAVRVVAIAATIVVVAAISVAIGERWGSSSAGRDEVAAAAMITPSGREVGTVWRYEGDPSWVFVSVPGWTAWDAGGGGGGGTGGGGDEARYRLVAALADGTEADLGAISFAAGGSWGTSTSVPASSLRRVAIVDDRGRTWCEGEF